MSPGNYLSHALDSARAFDGEIGALRSVARNAHVFQLPGLGDCLGGGLNHAIDTWVDFAGASNKVLRLPFPVTACEFYNGAKWVVLAHEPDPADPSAMLDVRDGIKSADLASVAFLVEFLAAAEGDDWMCLPFVYAVPRNLKERTDILAGVRRADSVQKLRELGADHYELGKTMTSRGLAALMSLLVALACKNVSTESVDPPVALQKARARRGKAPLYRYHVLKLNGSSGTAGERGGSHASPAMHLRRGHVRKLPRGDLTWVNAHVVGKPRDGVLMKDYDARPLAAKAPV